MNDLFSRKKTDAQMKDIGDYILVDKSFKIVDHNEIPLTAEKRTPGNRRVLHEITSLHFPSVLKVEFKLDDKSPSNKAPESAFESLYNDKGEKRSVPISISSSDGKTSKKKGKTSKKKGKKSKGADKKSKFTCTMIRFKIKGSKKKKK